MKKTKMTCAALAANFASIVGIIAIAAMVGFGFIACSDDETHKHSWSAEWSSNATQHWKECTDADCDAKTQTANHQNVYRVTSTSYPAQSMQTCNDCSKTTGTARNTIIGDTGPAGGIIFYVASSGFTVKGYTGTTGTFAEYTAYYLEAAPALESESLEWGAEGTLIDDVTTWGVTQNEYWAMLEDIATSIGSGRRDMQIIVNHLAKTGETNKAAQVCASKTVTVGGTVFNDWFLPSIGEIDEMYKARDHLGILSDYSIVLWSSSQGDDNKAYSYGFFEIGNGFPNYENKNIDRYVLAARAF